MRQHMQIMKEGLGEMIEKFGVKVHRHRGNQRWILEAYVLLGSMPAEGPEGRVSGRAHPFISSP